MPWGLGLGHARLRWVSAGALFILVPLALVVLAACAGTPPPPPPEPLVYYDYAGSIPTAIFDAFEAETGIAIRYLTYESTEEAVANLRAGKRYDVAIIGSRYIPSLIATGVLADLDRHQVENFKNIAPNFRGLVFDPNNRYSIPYSWGTTGMVVRPDLAGRAITRWGDMWDPALTGKVAIWRGSPREAIGLTLKSLGYSANSEDPAALAAVQVRLIELRRQVHFVEEWDPYNVGAAMARGEVAASMGYAYEARTVRELGKPVEYVLPAEGAVLWSDNFVVPATSQRQADAARLIDFLLRPEIAARIVEASYIQLANEAMLDRLPSDLRADSLVFAPDDQLRNAEILLPLSPAGEARYAEVWQAFLEADGIN